MNNSYRLLKLKSGEEIITRIKRVRNNTIVIERPMKLESSFTMDTHGNAKEITILKKWLRYTPQKQTSIPRDFVASFIKPNNDIMELYAIEKKKDDMDNSKKSKIIKPNNIQPKRDNYNKYNDIDYSEVNELMDFVNNNSDKMTPEHIKNIIDPDEYGNSWRDWSSNPDDYTNFDDNPDGL